MVFHVGQKFPSPLALFGELFPWVPVGAEVFILLHYWNHWYTGVSNCREFGRTTECAYETETLCGVKLKAEWFIVWKLAACWWQYFCYLREKSGKAFCSSALHTQLDPEWMIGNFVGAVAWLIMQTSADIWNTWNRASWNYWRNWHNHPSVRLNDKFWHRQEVASEHREIREVILSSCERDLLRDGAGQELPLRSIHHREKGFLNGWMVARRNETTQWESM